MSKSDISIPVFSVKSLNYFPRSHPTPSFCPAEQWCLKVDVNELQYSPNHVVRPYGVHLIPSCSALNADCNTVENNYGMMPLLNVVTEDYTTITAIILGQKKIMFDDKSAYDKAKWF